MPGTLKGVAHLPRSSARERRNAARARGSSLNLATDSGLAQDANGALTIDLGATPGLVLASGGLSALVQGVLTIDSSGIDLTVGDGLVKDSGTLKVDLTVTPGLEFSGGDLQAKLKSGGGIQKDSDGLSLKVDHAEIWLHNNSTADTTNGTIDTYDQFTRFANNGASSGATPDDSEDHITIATAGTYLVVVSIIAFGSSLNDMEFAVRVNDGAGDFLNLNAHRTMSTASSKGSVSISGLAVFAASDTVELWYKCTDGTSKSLTIENVTLSVVKISE